MLLRFCLALAPLLIQDPVQEVDDPVPDRGWLFEQQADDGRWDARGGGDEAESPSGAESDVLATSLALWTMIGEGQGETGTFPEEFSRALRWLLAQQELESGFVRQSEHPRDLVHHAIATAVLAQVASQAPGPVIDDACKRACAALTAAQRESGGFGRGDGPDDARATGWATYALVAAAMGGLPVDASAIDRAFVWLQERTDDEGLVRVDGPESDVDDVATALAVLCTLLGEPTEADRHELEPLAAALIRRLVEAKDADGERWFAVSAACYLLGGGAWREVSGHMKRRIVLTQRRADPAKGSWDPPAGAMSGRVVESLWNVLSLELYYRYARFLPAR